MISSSSGTEAYAADREASYSYRFDAPLPRVFAAWTDARSLASWWGASICELDARPGGRLHLVGREPDGQERRIDAAFREIVAPDWLVYAESLRISGDLLLESVTTVTLHDEADRTRLTIHCDSILMLDPRARTRWVEGWTQRLCKLERYLALSDEVNGVCRCG